MSANKNGSQNSGIGGASNSVPQSIFERNLEAFLDYARERGAEITQEGAIVCKGVTLSNDIRRDLADYVELMNPESLWRYLIFRHNCEAFVAFARERGAAVDENGAVVWEGVTLTHHIQWDVEAEGGDEKLLCPKYIWRGLVFVINASAWRKYCEAKGVRFDDWGWLYYKGKRLPVSGAEYLSQYKPANERFLSEKEMRALWGILLFMAGLSVEEK